MLKIEINVKKVKALLRWYKERGFTKSLTLLALLEQLPSLNKLVNEVWEEEVEDDRR